MSFSITTAERTNAPLSIYIAGESGSGKTYSSLLLARGLAGPNGKIGIIDTEGGRSKVYADDPDIGGFEHMDFAAPYSPERCIEATNAAVAAKWDVIVFDSASLEHDGEGGLLEMADVEEAAILKRNPQNRAASQQKWTKPKQRHKKWLNHATGLPSHIIMCFRETLTTDFKAKPPTTILTVVAEKNTKFVMEIHASIDANHIATFTRAPKPYLPCIESGKPITVETGRKLASNLDAVKTKEKASEPESDPDLDLLQLIDSHAVETEWFNKAIKLTYRGKFETWMELPDDHKRKLAVETSFLKIVAKGNEMKTQEGKS